MSNVKKKRLSMLDSLAAASPTPPAPSMMATNRALRSARDAVDSHHVWELDPHDILDDRMADRIDPSDVIDLRDAIEANGQAVPILVRRHHTQEGKYSLVYGRRRLEAIRMSEKVLKVKALVASLDDKAALHMQISENMARKDLSYIEKALFAQDLIASGFGNQIKVAEVLTVPKSAISMALTIVETVGAELIRTIGPAHGVGRPKWESLGRAIQESQVKLESLMEIAEVVYTKDAVDLVTQTQPDVSKDTSVRAFEAVLKHVTRKHMSVPKRNAQKPIKIDGKVCGSTLRSRHGMTLTLQDGQFADWVENHADDIVQELHIKWLENARGTQDS